MTADRVVSIVRGFPPSWKVVGKGFGYLHLSKDGAEVDRVHISVNRQDKGWSVSFFGFDQKGTGFFKTTGYRTRASAVVFAKSIAQAQESVEAKP